MEDSAKVTSAKKTLYHGAFGAGHLLAMPEAGVQLLMNAGLERAGAWKALLSLSRRVLENYEKLG